MVYKSITHQKRWRDFIIFLSKSLSLALIVQRKTRSNSDTYRWKVLPRPLKLSCLQQPMIAHCFTIATATLSENSEFAFPLSCALKLPVPVRCLRTSCSLISPPSWNSLFLKSNPKMPFYSFLILWLYTSISYGVMVRGVEKFMHKSLLDLILKSELLSWSLKWWV